MKDKNDDTPPDPLGHPDDVLAAAEVPPGVDPSHQRIRSASVVLPKDEAWVDRTRAALTVAAGVRHSSV